MYICIYNQIFFYATEFTGEMDESIQTLNEQISDMSSQLPEKG